jgi:hypothetical protein
VILTEATQDLTHHPIPTTMDVKVFWHYFARPRSVKLWSYDTTTRNVRLIASSDRMVFIHVDTSPEQGESGTQFRVDYIKPSGAIGLYHPDWVMVQKTDKGEVNWILETKGRVWDGTAAKDEAMREWCLRVSQATGKVWRFKRIDQPVFEANQSDGLAQLLNDGPQ